MTLQPHEESDVRQAIAIWAERHPDPDLPMLAIGDGVELSPRDILHAMHDPEDNEVRAKLLSVIDGGRRVVPLEEIVSEFAGVEQGQGL